MVLNKPKFGPIIKDKLVLSGKADAYSTVTLNVNGVEKVVKAGPLGNFFATFYGVNPNSEVDIKATAVNRAGETSISGIHLGAKNNDGIVLSLENDTGISSHDHITKNGIFKVSGVENQQWC